MPGLLRSYDKYAIERRLFFIDYTCWLEEGERLTNFYVVSSPLTADAPLTTNGAYSDGTSTKIKFYIGGGRAGVNYRVSLITETSEGQTKRDDIGVRIVAL